MPNGLPDTVTISELTTPADSCLYGVTAVTDTVNSLLEAAVYGGNSRPLTVPPEDTIAQISPLTGNVWFQTLSLAALAFFCWMIYYFRGPILLCLKGLFNFQSDDKFTSEQGYLYNGFINYAVSLSALSCGILVIKLVSGHAGSQLLERAPAWTVPPAAIVVSAVFAVILAFKYSVLRAAGRLTFSSAVTDTVTGMKKLHLAAGAVLIAPFILLYTGSHPAWDSAMIYIITIETVTVTLFFVLKTLLLFMRQKVSLLVWILYLCAVEIFPISLVVLLAVKNV